MSVSPADAARLQVSLLRFQAEAGRLTVDVEHPALAGVETEDLALAAATCAGVVRPRG